MVANVLYWAWSGNKPFGWIGSSKDPEAIPVYGLAIAQYEGDSTIYRFSCNENWEMEQDATYATVDEAMTYLPEQYREEPANWQKF